MSSILPGAADATLVMLLAGGVGERLHPLTKRRAKPAVPFAGCYRIVDFTLANCLNSGLRRVYVLTQHHALSLDRHVRVAWSILHPSLDEFIQTVPPQLQLVSRWYAGTADAVFQNLYLLDAERPRRVVVLSGDHVYRMDYRPLLEFHDASGAALTIACTRVPVEEGTRMGVVAVDAEARVRSFAEKPADPVPLAAHPDQVLANMGVYVFETEPLVRALIADAKDASEHDFGRNILPRMLASHRVFGFDTCERLPPEYRFWRDVGTLDAYFETTMAFLSLAPPFDLADPAWPMRTHVGGHPAALVRSAGGREASAVDCMLSAGATVAGASVVRSVLSPGVRVDPGAVVEDAIVMPGVHVGAGAVVRRAIIDENVHVPAGARIGQDLAADRRRYRVTEAGVVVVAEGTAFV